MVNWESKKLEYYLTFLIGLVSLLLLNLFGQSYFWRVDLTQDKRYSISKATVSLLEELDDQVYINVYLDGDLPSDFKRLQNAIIETLDVFAAYSGDKIQYQFIDPSLAKSKKAQNEYFMSLANKGIQPTNLYANEGGKKSQKLVFPGLVISYHGVEAGVMLLKGNKGANPSEIINQSIEGIEFEIANGIRKLTNRKRDRIGYILGHGELDSLDIADITNTLLTHYDVYKINLSERDKLDDYDAVIIAKPDTSFSEDEKYKLDQYIMNGGKALFFIDMLRVNMDSAGMDGTYAFPKPVNLDDMLFKYGVRINRDYIQDLNFGFFPVVTDFGDQPQIQNLPWPFFIQMNHLSNHAITRNMNGVYGRFVSSIDTILSEGITKTPLISTSSYSKRLSAPVSVRFDDFKEYINKDKYPPAKSNIVAILLEGKFTSLYKNRILPKSVKDDEFVDMNDQPTKIIVCSDGDLLRNELTQKNAPLPLGFDPYTQVTFSNKEFVLNAISYLLNGDGIINARSKEVTLRPLDKVKVEEGKYTWQMINMIIPVLFIVMLGFTVRMYRKYKYER